MASETHHRRHTAGVAALQKTEEAERAAAGAGRVEAFYLDDGPQPVSVFLHSSARETRSVCGVLICPPFGWDEICSYRSRRDWAEHLAQAGFPAMRLDLPATGDSGGTPRDEELLSSWTAAVGSAAASLRALAGVEHIVAIGIGLGGLLACKAISERAAIDDLVLWGVPARGRTLVRELRVFASLEDSALGPVDDKSLAPAPLPGAGVWAGGFAMQADTVQELEALDLCQLSFPSNRRVMMLDRDGIAVDERLRAHLEHSGMSVTLAAGGGGYSAMMAKPHYARSPTAAFARVDEWLEEASAAPEPAPPAVAARRTPPETVEIASSGVAVRERPFKVRQPFGELFGVLGEPLGPASADLCAVMLNAGAIRHIGPNRMWVEAARRWAALGVSTLRLDVEGIGDADGDAERFSELAELYDPALVDQVSAALDELQARGVGRRFVLVGLCSGAHWAFHAALRDERVKAALMLNPQALFWDPSLEAARDLRRAVHSSSWQKVVRGEVPLERIVNLAVHAPFALPRRALAKRHAQENELDGALDELARANKLVRFFFSGKEPLHEELERDGYLARLGRWPTVTVERLPGRVHTLRPYEAQKHAHAALDRALQEVLRAGAPPARSDS